MFKPGDKVVCIKKFIGKNYYTNIDSDKKMPIVGETYKVVRIKASGFLVLHGFDAISGYVPTKFRKLDYNFVEEVLKNAKPKKTEILEDLFNNILPNIYNNN